METYNPFSLKDKTILITGASSGIGRQCAIDCSKMGARVILMGRNEERLKDTQADVVTDCLIKSLDLNNIDSIKGCIIDIVENFGKIDGFIHAAGTEKTLPVKFLKATDYKELFNVNALSSFEFIKYLSNKKYSNDNASFVLISSISAVIGRIGVSAYSASKGALISATKCIAIELASRNIRVNCISPGTILTSMMESYLSQLDESSRKKRLEGFPLGIGRTTDISNACIYLLSDASRWVTGTNLIVDGGYTAK